MRRRFRKSDGKMSGVEVFSYRVVHQVMLHFVRGIPGIGFRRGIRQMHTGGDCRTQIRAVVMWRCGLCSNICERCIVQNRWMWVRMVMVMAELAVLRHRAACLVRKDRILIEIFNWISEPSIIPDKDNVANNAQRLLRRVKTYRRLPCPLRAESSASWQDPASAVPSKLFDSMARGPNFANWKSKNWFWN